LARPAGLEPATSWFVAAMPIRHNRGFTDEFEACHARLPRDGGVAGRSVDAV